MIAGSCATKRYQPRQVRKEAAVVTSFVCRRGAWLSPPKKTERIAPNANMKEKGYDMGYALWAKPESRHVL